MREIAGAFISHAQSLLSPKQKHPFLLPWAHPPVRHNNFCFWVQKKVAAD